MVVFNPQNIIMILNLTSEQNEILNCDLYRGEILKIIAFAGTGKTTTLIEYSKKRPNLQFLYVAFNKSVQNEAISKFPKNVKCRTAHSIAWQYVGKNYASKLIPNLKAYFINKELELNDYELSKFVGETLYNYLISSDREISKKHIPKRAFQFYNHNKSDIPDLISFANIYWLKMQNLDYNPAGMLHDGYLKLFQLSNPILNFDVVMLDEAQDLNPVIADIFIKQNCSKIVVGDPHQQIYSFRGAQNILDNIETKKIKYLTNSFRFSSRLARIANYILESYKNEPKQLIGLKNPEDLTKTFYTYIARTNASIFAKSVSTYKKNSIGFIGGIQGYRFDDILDTFYLLKKLINRIKNSFIALFSTYSELKMYAESAEDIELLGICKVVETYNDSIPFLISEVKKHSVPAEMAEVKLSTAHKAKGLEWDIVCLEDDFVQLIDDQNNLCNPKSIDPDEFNLLYVSITRAKQSIKVRKGSSLRRFLKYKDEQKVKQQKKVDILTAEKNNCGNCVCSKTEGHEMKVDYDPEARENEYQKREIMEELGFSRYIEGDSYESSDPEVEEYLRCTNQSSPNFKLAVHPRQKCDYWNNQQK
jgi:F-box protein, helicase, 18